MILNTKQNRTNTRTNTRNKSNRLTNKQTSNTNPNTKKINSQLESLKVSYPDTLLQSIQNNQDITQFLTIYQNAPQISILKPKPRLYLISMTDPDAPYGMVNTKNTNTAKTTNKTTNKTNSNTSTKNHTYTHWIYLQDMRNKSNTITSLMPYTQPSPPYGIHRYQIKLYDVSNVSQMILDTLKKNINNTLDRNIDYISNLNKLNIINNTKKLKPIVQLQYKVNSGKVHTITNTSKAKT
jgi:phosphatidylethanolamine-binding protein (PEBP) family uncharacterized protein